MHNCSTGLVFSSTCALTPPRMAPSICLLTLSSPIAKDLAGELLLTTIILSTLLCSLNGLPIPPERLSAPTKSIRHILIHRFSGLPLDLENQLSARKLPSLETRIAALIRILNHIRFLMAIIRLVLVRISIFLSQTTTRVVWMSYWRRVPAVPIPHHALECLT